MTKWGFLFNIILFVVHTLLPLMWHCLDPICQKFLKSRYDVKSHPKTECFVVSQLFSVTRHVGRLKLGLKPAPLYVRLSIILHSLQANHISLVIIRHYVVTFVCLHFCLTRYQSDKFIWRALHYASGSR